MTSSEHSIDTSALPGISGMSLYVPAHRVDLEQWCSWTGNSWDKVKAVVGKSFRVPGPHENVYTMAANAVLRLIEQYDVDPSRVGFLGLGTESSTDNDDPRRVKDLKAKELPKCRKSNTANDEPK